MDPKPTSYITTDLDLFAKFDLKPLSESLVGLGLCNLGKNYFPDASYWGFRQGVYLANFEVWARTLPKGRHTPEREIVGMLNLLESMPPPMRRIWNRCLSRRFNIGYQSGNDPFAFHSRITSKTLARVAALKIEIEITIYQIDPPEYREGVTKPEQPPS